MKRITLFCALFFAASGIAGVDFDCTVRRIDFTYNIGTNKPGFEDHLIAKASFGLNKAPTQFAKLISQDNSTKVYAFCLAVKEDTDANNNYWCGVFGMDDFLRFGQKGFSAEDFALNVKRVNHGGSTQLALSHGGFLQPLPSAVYYGDSNKIINVEHIIAGSWMSAFTVQCVAQ